VGARPSVETIHAVRLVGVPVGAFLATQAHYDGVFREFTLISMAPPSDGDTTSGLPADLLARVEQIRNLRGPIRDALEQTVTDAYARREETVDVELPFLERALRVTEEQAHLQDEIDEQCRAGRLMMLAAPPVVVAFRRHWAEELVRQVRHGLPPRPFPRG
jgi:hypothetical protein